ncbi:MAG TPA: AraC family transcriptional regulator [Polyangiaceae bacterium]|jgi:AraC-like DNA-binding protein|nr:AraC family transcriptional regulator [Polyangiaceae bacterium]
MPSSVEAPHDPLETLCVHALHASRAVAVYDVRCRPHDKQRGPEERPLSHQIVFPRRGVFEFESRGVKLMADPNHVLFFNRDEGYRVAHPAGAGDDCTVFAFEDRVLRDALELVDPRWLDSASLDATHTGADALARPFRFAHGLNDERTFWAHEKLRHAAQSPQSNSLARDEAAVELLSAVLHSAYESHGRDTKAIRPSTRAAHTEVVQRASLFLATAFGDDASLDDVGRAAHASPFHLARLFRRESGLSIHQYRHRLRMRAALARIADGESDLSRLALDLGFSSHSHLTDAFRLAFGISPSECRKSLNVHRFREMSRDLEVTPRAKT